MHYAKGGIEHCATGVLIGGIWRYGWCFTDNSGALNFTGIAIGICDYPVTGFEFSRLLT